jgi:hypothetical protein
VVARGRGIPHAVKMSFSAPSYVPRTMARLASCCLFGVLLAGCTSHTRDESPRESEQQAPESPNTRSPALDLEPTAAPEPSWLYTSPGPRTALRSKPLVGVAGEVDGDGHPDLLTLAYLPDSSDTGLVLLAGRPDGSFVEGEPLVVEGSGLELGDVDGDGDLDALIFDASSRPRLRVAKNDGGGGFRVGAAQPIPGRYGGELRHAARSDLDGDGDLDLVIPLWDSLRIMVNDGRGSFSAGQRLASGRDPFDCVLADLDGDGDLDLAATSGAGVERDADAYHSSGASVWLYRRGARRFAESGGVYVAAAAELEAVDLDGDGQLELAATGSAGITVVRDPLGEREIELTHVANDGPLLVAELAAPPGPDLATASFMQGRVHVLGDYPKLHKSSVEAGDFVVGMFSLDLAGDGTLPDLVLLNAGPPPGGHYGAPGSSVEVLWVARPM